MSIINGPKFWIRTAHVLELLGTTIPLDHTVETAVDCDHKKCARCRAPGSYSRPRMLGFARRLGWLCLLCTLTTHARAEGDEVLRVTRSAGAEACPDAAALLRRVEAIRGRSDSSETS